MLNAMAANARYREIAEHLEQAIRAGVHPPGGRLPSVRVLARTWDASLTTVAAAFDLLTQRGVVEARPQSGHFARVQAHTPAPGASTISLKKLQPTTVDLGQLALAVLRDSQEARLVPAGPAFPDPALLPQAELDRLLIRLTRDGRTGLSGYCPPPGLPALRTELARHAAGFGCVVAADQLVITAGALDGVTLALRATCRAGQTVAVESPVYYGLLQTIAALDLRVIEIPTDPHHGISLAALREALDEHPVAAVIAMPTGSNPLGCRASEATTRDLVELLAARKIPLIEDDALGDLALDGSRPRPAKSFDRAGLVLWTGSLSKTIAPGLRIGWLAAGRFQAAVEHLQFTQAVGLAPLTQELAAAFLAAGGLVRTMRRARPLYRERNAALAGAISASFPAGTRVGQPAVGFCLWVELPEGCDGQVGYTTALRLGIGLTPGRLFSAKPRYRRFIRLCAARWDESWRAPLARLGAALAKV